MSTMDTARDIMSDSVHAISTTSTVYNAALLMSDQAVSCLVVLEHEKPIGIITERDLLRKVLVKNKSPKSIKVNSIMSSPLITVKPEDDLSHMSNIMHYNNVRRVPVMEDNVVIGIVTQTDVVRATGLIHAEHKKMKLHMNIQSVVVVIGLILTIILLYQILS